MAEQKIIDYLTIQFGKLDEKDKYKTIKRILKFFDDIKYQDLLNDKTIHYRDQLSLKKISNSDYLTNNLKVIEYKHQDTIDWIYTNIIIDFKEFRLDVSHHSEICPESNIQIYVNIVINDKIIILHHQNNECIQKIHKDLNLSMLYDEFYEYITCFFDKNLY